MDMVFVDDDGARTDANGQRSAKAYEVVQTGAGAAYLGVGEIVATLPAGFYLPQPTPTGFALLALDVKTDSLLSLPDPVTDVLLREFVTFWERADRFAARGLAVKRGLLLTGPPGSGKTSAVQLMCAHMIRERDGVVLLVNDINASATVLKTVFRRIEPTRPLICVFEDVDALIETQGEHRLLALLDGEAQLGSVVNVATCNYPERLDPRFVDRPGRFDRIAEVGMPSAEARRVFLTSKAPELDVERMDRWVAASEGWSLAHLRELVAAALVLEEPDDAVIQRLSAMRVERPSSDRFDKGLAQRRFGFDALGMMRSPEVTPAFNPRRF